MIYHVNSYYPDGVTLASAEAFLNKDIAETSKNEGDALDTLLNALEDKEYAARLHDSLLDIDSNDDTLPHPPKHTRYIRKVESCNDKKRCIACFEAGFIN